MTIDNNKEETTVGTSHRLTVSQTVDIFNQIFDTAVPSICIEGEVANFKVSQGKWVFFDLKDESSSLSCFMSLYSLRIAIEDGMRVIITAKPKVTAWGKLSLTVNQVKPLGEGSIKKAFELLRRKLSAEGLFDSNRKRSLPNLPDHIGVISSANSAGYKDFIKIIGDRMGGLKISLISTQVQGDAAPDQIIAALHQFNQMPDPPQVIAVVRGGGSRDDLVAFDDEKLVRTVAGSRIPVLTGVGHEIDTTLIDLVADVRAATPSNAAEVLVPDKREIISVTNHKLQLVVSRLSLDVDSKHRHLKDQVARLADLIRDCVNSYSVQFKLLNQTLNAYNPRNALDRGYSLLWRGESAVNTAKVGDNLTIETKNNLIDVEVKSVREK